MADTLPQACPRCGKALVCGMQAGQSRCWCMDFPPLLPVPSADPKTGCYCPECLAAVLEERQGAERSR